MWGGARPTVIKVHLSSNSVWFCDCFLWPAHSLYEKMRFRYRKPCQSVMCSFNTTFLDTCCLSGSVLAARDPAVHRTKSRRLSSIPCTALPLPSVMHREGSEVMRTGEEGKITHGSSKLCLTDLKGKHTATWLGRGVRKSVLRSYNPSLPTEHPHPDFVSQCQGLLWPRLFLLLFF